MKLFRSHIDVLFIIGVLITFFVSVVVDVFSIIQITSGGFLIMLAPGYLVLTILFPDKTKINILERIVFSIVISFSEVILLAYILNFSIWGITKWAFIIGQLFVLISLVMVSVAQRIYYISKKREIFEFEFNTFPIIQNLKKFDNIEILLFFFMLFSVLITVIVSVYAFEHKQEESFTEFYMVGEDGRMESLPKVIGVDEYEIVVIVIENHENSEAEYILKIDTGESKEQTFTPRLNNGAIWITPITLEYHDSIEFLELTFNLYFKNFDSPYRSIQYKVMMEIEE